jgi:hypothetical protein
MDSKGVERGAARGIAVRVGRLIYRRSISWGVGQNLVSGVGGVREVHKLQWAWRVRVVEGAARGVAARAAG